MLLCTDIKRGFQSDSVGKNPPANQCRRCGFDPWVRKIPWRRKWQPAPVFWPAELYELYSPLEKAMAPHSSALAWKIPWMEEPGRLQTMRSQRVGHDRATSLSLFTFMHWRRNWQPSVLAWRTPGTGDPGWLLSMELHRVGHDWSNVAAAAAPVSS